MLENKKQNREAVIPSHPTKLLMLENASLSILLSGLSNSYLRVLACGKGARAPR